MTPARMEWRPAALLLSTAFDAFIRQEAGRREQNYAEKASLLTYNRSRKARADEEIIRKPERNI
jgi:hypothetical protein